MLPCAADSPQPAQLLQRDLRPFGRRGVSLRPAAPAQRVPDLLERGFPAHRPIEHVRADLADGLHRFPISLPMEELVFRLRHAGEGAEIGAEDPGEVDRSDRVVEAGVIPVMAIFLTGRILLLSDHVARECTLQRAVAHRDLAGIAALEVRASPAYPLRRRPGALLEQWPRALRQFPHFDSERSRSICHRSICHLPFPVHRRWAAGSSRGSTRATTARRRACASVTSPQGARPTPSTATFRIYPLHVHNVNYHM